MEIVCRSSEQIYEDHLCELHTRLTRWTRELRNEPCFTARECERKRDKLTRMQTLIDSVEDAMLWTVSFGASKKTSSKRMKPRDSSAAAVAAKVA